MASAYVVHSELSAPEIDIKKGSPDATSVVHVAEEMERRRLIAIAGAPQSLPSEASWPNKYELDPYSRSPLNALVGW